MYLSNINSSQSNPHKNSPSISAQKYLNNYIKPTTISFSHHHYSQYSNLPYIYKISYNSHIPYFSHQFSHKYLSSINYNHSLISPIILYIHGSTNSHESMQILSKSNNSAFFSFSSHLPHQYSTSNPSKNLPP